MKLVMQPAISLDGFIAKPDGDSYSWVNQADEARHQEQVKKCGCVITGNTTYEEYKDDFAKYKNVTIFVLTRNVDTTDTEQIKYVQGKATDIVEYIEKQGFKEAVVCGGGEINGLLAEAGLVDEIVISIQSVVLGEGIPLFGAYKPNLNLELLSVNQDIPGVIQSHYRVAQ